MVTQQRQIVVIGAGYAGLLATVRLAGRTRRLPVAITLVNESEWFVERPRLHQFAANQPIKPRPLRAALAGTRAEFLCGRVTDISPDERILVVETAAGQSRLPYDDLIYALGSTIDCQSVPGAQEHAYRLTPGGPLSADALRIELPAIAGRGGRLVVVGGGATGIEAAAEFSDAYPQLQISLVARGEFGAFMTPKVTRYMRQALSRLRVAIADQTTVTRVESNRVLTESGVAFPFDLCLWTGGFRVPALAADAGIQVNDRGQILVDPFLRSISHPNITAVGDAADPVENPGAPMRMSAVTAVITGAHAADCLAADLKGRKPRPLGFAWLGQGISLGRRDAVGLNNYPDDVQKGPIFAGRLAVAIREFFVHFLAALPAFERRWPGFFVWLGKGRGSRVTVHRPGTGLFFPRKAHGLRFEGTTAVRIAGKNEPVPLASPKDAVSGP